MLRSIVFLLLLQVAAICPALAAVEGRCLASGRPVADAVVWLDAPGRPAATNHAVAVLDQRNLTFSPHVLAIQTGTMVEFPNHDRVFHNVFSYHDGRRFDLGLYPVGATRKERFDRPGLCRLFCNIHAQMAAYIMVVSTPYFGVSDSHGRFTLQAAAPGHYTYHAWRPGGEEISGGLTLQDGEPVVIQWVR